MKIVVDGFGGDFSPNEIVKGCVMAVNEIKDLEIIITGKEEIIKNLLAEFKYKGNKISIAKAETVITCDDENPAKLIRSMPDSSIVVALDILKQNEDVVAMISAGSTGAVLSGGFLKLGRIKGISRPALAPTLPTKIPGKGVVLLDCGANADCKPINLAHFAIMGSIYSQTVYGVENPKVALLSVGVEDAKGSMLSKSAFKLLKNLPINLYDEIQFSIDVKMTEEEMLNSIRKSISGYLTRIIRQSSHGQTRKGILTTGPQNSISYALEKLKKGRKKEKINNV